MANAIQFAILGLGAGAAYTLLAQGIVLIYRGSGIVNFAHGGIAMFASFFCFLTLVEQHGWPIELAIPVSVLVAALLGVAIQNLVLRFMRNTAPLVRLVATLGILIVLQGLGGQQLWDVQFHQIDQFLPSDNYTLHQWFGFHGELGTVVVQEDRLILLGIAILLTFVLWAFTRYTKVGLAITASAENERAAAALGWSPNLLATITWAIGGATAGFAGILLAPNAGLSLSVFTIVVTVAALAVALIGGFTSFPLTLLGGIGLGIAESEVLTYSSARDRGRRHRSPARAAVPGDRRGARRTRQGAPTAQPRAREAPRPRDRRRDALVPDHGRRRAGAPEQPRVRRQVVDCAVHVAHRRDLHPLDGGTDRIRGTAVARAICGRWFRRAVRGAPRRGRALARGARVPRRRRVRDHQRLGLCDTRVAHPRHQPRRGDARNGVRRPADDLLQHVFHRQLWFGDDDREDQGVRLECQRRGPSRAVLHRLSRRLRRRGAHGCQPATIPFGTTAHRRAQQRTGGGVPGDQCLWREAVRLRGRRGHRVVRRDSARASRSTPWATRWPAASAGCSAPCSAATLPTVDSARSSSTGSTWVRG
ncbi:MAG: branched-chain amino acid ABC transporter permease [Actinobacteria bacterium]|nr:MAG: branched-chain amino acid ABC transporter permease [Actinomycetota bacterium]